MTNYDSVVSKKLITPSERRVGGGVGAAKKVNWPRLTPAAAVRGRNANFVLLRLVSKREEEEEFVQYCRRRANRTRVRVHAFFARLTSKFFNRIITLYFFMLKCILLIVIHVSGWSKIGHCVTERLLLSFVRDMVSSFGTAHHSHVCLLINSMLNVDHPNLG